ncbi:hypothetical protein Syun_005990 [Stephania yunnanensis]|uniref:Uncharacterized protein n=1 Tax=Stephania yunnanensis TaxID=152371 RepID=A0AAP0KXF0_9MAGN
MPAKTRKTRPELLNSVFLCPSKYIKSITRSVDSFPISSGKKRSKIKMGGSIGGCVDANFDNTNYSSPVPVIGLYVAGSTVLCLLLMILDVGTAFHSRKTWLPCRFFSLNSVTLTLLSVVTKLSVDLTTTMPGVQDQLSKLTSTTLVCICMGFSLPSLGTNSESECFSNVAALSILVVTIFVNVCIQLHTGLIILFRIQHIVILGFMMALLLIFWTNAFEINEEKQSALDYMKWKFANGEKSMLHRLKASYLYSYDANPQFMICKDAVSSSAGMICIVCSCVLLASLASAKLRFCEMNSDYEWSMNIIVVSQTITIALGSFSTTFRFLTMLLKQAVGFNRLQILKGQVIDADAIMSANPLIRRTGLDFWIYVARVFTLICFGFVLSLLMAGFTVVLLFVHLINIKDILEPKKRDYKAINEVKEFVHIEEADLNDWVLKKGMDDMKRWIESVNQTKASSNHHLFQLLSKRGPSPSQEGTIMSSLKSRYERSNYHEISSLSILLLVRIATASIPFSLSESLLKSLNEVFEIIHFVDTKINPANPVNKMRSRLAKAMWAGYDFSVLFPKSFETSTENEASDSESQVDLAVRITKWLKYALPPTAKFVPDELAIITDFILEHRNYSSIEDLYEFLEQMFVDMLNELLIQLPNAIYKSILESSSEDFEERMKFALEAILKIEQLEELVQWSFPSGTTITRLITDEAPLLLGRHDMPLQISKTFPDQEQRHTRISWSRSFCCSSRWRSN